MAPVLDALDAVSKATIEQQPSTAYQKAFHAGLAPRIQRLLQPSDRLPAEGLALLQRRRVFWSRSRLRSSSIAGLHPQT